MWRYVLVTAVLVAGCTSERLVQMPDGGAAHMIVCDGVGQDIQDCRAKAVAICSPHNYTVVGQRDGADIYGYVTNAMTAGTRSMAIRCNTTPILPLSPQQPRR